MAILVLATCWWILISGFVWKRFFRFHPMKQFILLQSVLPILYCPFDPTEIWYVTTKAALFVSYVCLLSTSGLPLRATVVLGSIKLRLSFPYCGADLCLFKKFGCLISLRRICEALIHIGAHRTFENSSSFRLICLWLLVPVLDTAGSFTF